MTAFAGCGIVPPCMDITSPWSDLTRTSPVGSCYRMNSVEGRWGETSETRHLTPAGSQNAGHIFREEAVDTSHREHRSWWVGDAECQLLVYPLSARGHPCDLRGGAQGRERDVVDARCQVPGTSKAEKQG